MAKPTDKKKADSNTSKGVPKPSEAKPDDTTKQPNDGVPNPVNQDSDEDSKPFDFGGLPNRNLKKNLGCG